MAVPTSGTIAANGARRNAGSHACDQSGHLPGESDANGLQLPFNQRFLGQTAFDESGLNYNYFRDYDPQTGRRQ